MHARRHHLLARHLPRDQCTTAILMDESDILTSMTGQFNVIILKGHVKGFTNAEGIKAENIKPQEDHRVFLNI